MMTLDEYTKAVKNDIMDRLKAEPKKDVQKYILKLEAKGKIKASYEQDTDKELAEITGSEAKPDPAGFCYSISLLYPDIP